MYKVSSAREAVRKTIKCLRPACMLDGPHRLWNHLTPFKTNVLAGNIHRVLGKTGLSDTFKYAASSIVRVVAHGAPAALIKDLEAAKLCVPVLGGPSLGKSYITSTCTTHILTS